MQQTKIQEYVDAGLKRRNLPESHATVVTSQTNFDYEVHIHGTSPFRFTIQEAGLKDFTDAVKQVIDDHLDTFIERSQAPSI